MADLPTKCVLEIPFQTELATLEDGVWNLDLPKLNDNLERVETWTLDIQTNGCCRDTNALFPTPTNLHKAGCVFYWAYPTNPSHDQMRENFEVLEQWSALVATGTCCNEFEQPDSETLRAKCQLEVPHKPSSFTADQLRDNFEVIERWGVTFLLEGCCGCSSAPPA